MTLISRQTLTGSAASVTFNSIPQTFQTLKLVVSGRATSTNATMQVRPNGVTTNLSNRLLFGNGSVAQSNTSTNIQDIGLSISTDTASTFGSLEILFPNYAGSANKAVFGDGVTENNASTAYQSLSAGLWSNTSAITGMTLVVAAGDFASGSTFSLYGIS